MIKNDLKENKENKNYKHKLIVYSIRMKNREKGKKNLFIYSIGWKSEHKNTKLLYKI